MAGQAHRVADDATPPRARACLRQTAWLLGVSLHLSARAHLWLAWHVTCQHWHGRVRKLTSKCCRALASSSAAACLIQCRLCDTGVNRVCLLLSQDFEPTKGSSHGGSQITFSVHCGALCRRGSWHAHTAGNANRASVTLLPCVSAAGKVLPPLESDSATLDLVLDVLGNLVSISADASIRQLVVNALEKRWATCDQDMFVLLLNPARRTKLFNPDCPTVSLLTMTPHVYAKVFSAGAAEADSEQVQAQFMKYKNGKHAFTAGAHLFFCCWAVFLHARPSGLCL